MASRILWQPMVGFISLAMIMAIGILILGLAVTLNLTSRALIFAGTALFTAMGMAVAGLMTDEQATGALPER